MRPRIGINCDVHPGARRRGDGRLFALNPEYAKAIQSAGGLPLVVPPLAQSEQVDAHAIETLLDSIDALLLTGGDDLHPRVYGQPLHPKAELMDVERDAADVALARAALERGVPILGICAGMQLLNVALGGSLHQHLADLRGSRYPALLPIHDAQETDAKEHGVVVERGARLAAAVGAGAIVTNSRHHQAIDRVADGLVVTALAEDGVIEGVELDDGRFVIGVQWHPEEMAADSGQRRLFEAFIDAARKRTAGVSGRSAR